MTLIPPETLRSAVQAGILNEAQAVRLSVHLQTEFGFRAALSRDDEPFEFFRGFSEIFVTLGLSLLWGGALGLIGLSVSWMFAHFCCLVLCLGLARYFTLIRRMSLPSIALALGAAVNGSAVFSIGFFELGSFEKAPLMALAALGMGGMALYFKVFKLPFAMFLFGLFAMLLSYSVALDLTDISLAPANFPEMFFNLGIGAPVAYASLGLGFAMMALGLWFDMQDPHRLGRFSATGFWLHILAAPALVNTAAFSLYKLGGTTGYLSMACLLLLVTVFALIIDRRSFLTAGLFYFIAVIVWITNQALGEAFGGVSIVFILGVLFTALGTWWASCRRQHGKILGHPRRRSGSRVRAASNHTAASYSSRGDRRAGNWATDQSYVLPSPLQCRTHLDEGSPRRPAKFSSARTIGAGSTYQKASGERRDPTDTL